MSQHQAQRLIASGQTKGMINAYICADLHIMITKNIDNGFIPSVVGCTTCGKESQSRSYNVNQNLAPIIEWYQPTQGEVQAALLKMDKKKAEQYQQYINERGLISRLVPPAEEIKGFTKETGK